MAVCIDACATQETVVVTTRASIYEIIVLRVGGDDVLVRGGRVFSDFTPAVFVGSIADDGSLEPRTIGVGLRMKFRTADQLVVTSPVQSFSVHTVDAASIECAATL
jgi:hypothetical protein